MGDGIDNMPASAPVFLLDDESGPSNGVTRSIDEPETDRDVRPSAGTMLEYPAQIADLRIMTPYKVELGSKLGADSYVLQFQEYTLDSVPNEWKRKSPPLLWDVTVPGSSCPVHGYVTDQDLRTFYFRCKEDARAFLSSIMGEFTAPGYEETLEQRDHLNRLLG